MNKSILIGVPLCAVFLLVSNFFEGGIKSAFLLAAALFAFTAYNGFMKDKKKKQEMMAAQEPNDAEDSTDQATACQSSGDIDEQVTPSQPSSESDNQDTRS